MPSAARALALLAAAAVVASLVPAASSLGTSGFATVVDGDDGDFTGVLAPTSLSGLDYVDDDADGLLDPDEPVYLTAGGSHVAALDVRIANPATGVKGSQVRASHADFGNALAGPLAGAFSFLDSDGDGAFTPGDVLYFDDSTSDVSVGDLVLSGANAGTVVTGSHASLGSVLLSASAGLALLDNDGDGFYGMGDVVVLDGTGAGAAFAGPQDVLLSGPSFGQAVSSTGPLSVAVLSTAMPLASIAYHDADDDGAQDATERVYLTDGAGSAEQGAVRLSNAGAFGEGSQVTGADADFGAALTAIGGAFAFADDDGDGAFTPGETLYFDRGSSGLVSALDIVLSGPGFGEVVGAGHAGLNAALLAHPASPAYLDVDADGVYGGGDVVVLDGPLDPSYATVQDVVLGGAQAGTVLAGSDGLTVFRLGVPSGFALSSLAYVDDDADGNLDGDEAVYLAGGAAVAANDVRVAHPISGTLPGTQVRAVDSDFGNPLTALAGAFAFYDADGDLAFSAGDTAYYDSDGSGHVSVRDVVLSGSSGGSLVTGSSAGLNSLLVALGHTFAAFDADGDGVYTRGDIVYLDGPLGAGFATAQDIRLSGSLPGGGESGTSTTSGTGTASGTSTDPCATPSATPSPTATATATATPSPAYTAGFPRWVLTVGASNVVSMSAGESRTVPVTVAARGLALTYAHLVVDDDGGLQVAADPQVRTVRAGGEQVFYLHIRAACLDGADNAAYLVKVHVEGRNGATEVATLQVVLYEPVSDGQPIPGGGVLLSAAAIATAAAVAWRRRLA